jgi:ubiquinone/menaquinone biosynthesis C-methylase UbiE
MENNRNRSEENILSSKDFSEWVSHIEKYRLPLIKELGRKVELSGTGLELGAGTCWLSSTLSKEENIKKIFAMDIDVERLHLAKEKFIGYFKGKTDKIEIIRGDYHSLPFERGSVDFIAIDAALHHSNDISRLLNECKRVLRPLGFLVAIREPILPRVEPLKTYRKLSFGRREKKKGDIENIYSQQQWKKFFEEAGFSLDIFESFLDTTKKERLIKKLGFLNGLIFSRHFFVGKSLDDGKGSLLRKEILGKTGI